MAVFNLGSINIDNVYRVPHLPEPGETLTALGFQQGLGGKGANMSVAIARAAARAIHIGAVGADGRWAKDRMMEYGVDTRHIVVSQEPTGHANICVSGEDGENNIVLLVGANHAINDNAIARALREATPEDILLMQNETNGQAEAVRRAKDIGMRVAYAAAPFDIEAIKPLLATLDILVMNKGEADQLVSETGTNLGEIGVSDIIVTRGAQGCLWLSKEDRTGKSFDAIETQVVDTTGAGDTFTGYLVAGLDRGLPMAQSIGLAMRAASLMVARLGTADVIPDLKDIEDQRFA